MVLKLTWGIFCYLVGEIKIQRVRYAPVDLYDNGPSKCYEPIFFWIYL